MFVKQSIFLAFPNVKQEISLYSGYADKNEINFRIQDA